MSKKYFILRGERQDGPYLRDDLEHFAKAGVLKGDDLCATEDNPEWRPVRSVIPNAKARRSEIPGLLIAGVLLCVIGAAAAFYFFFVFDVSLASEAGRVANLDLMNQRQNGVILSAAAALAGVGCLIANAVKRGK